MSKIKLKLVNVKFHKGHDGMPGFNAELSYRGNKIATAYDDSWCGGYQYNSIGRIDTPERDANDRLFNELLEDVGKNYEYDGDIRPSNEMLIDFLVDDLLNELTLKRDSKKGVVFKTEFGHRIEGWNQSLPTIIKNEGAAGLKDIQDLYDSMKKEGKEILNGEYLKSIGVNL